MRITTSTGLLGFLLALSALNIPTAEATTQQPTIAERLNRITNTIKEQEAQLPNLPSDIKDNLMLAGWLNGGGGGGFLNRTWRNGWADGGGFYNRGGGGSFWNR